MANVTRRIAETAAIAAVLYATRRYYRNWGTTKAECRMPLPGDALVADPAIQTTEAEYIDAPVSAVWPWLVQLAQGHREADGIHPEWQHLALGDAVRLASPAWLGQSGEVTMTVAEIVPEKCLVLRATRPDQHWDAVWSFHIQPHWEDRVRLLTRARVALRHPGEVFAMELVRPGISLGTRTLLLRVKHRAERATATQPVREIG
ncbi:SRPBCC family protein [Mycobacterium sp. Marseille-P9652]|uniref:SRPBCC family protein n=1 Tax=Mycobacterium sp. Marseille-P9652 TaxID=2654950 RepID=UPI0012E7450E|nr:SRPBCC family protein [Mycobacterium sp. Marseille-P9652]